MSNPSFLFIDAFAFVSSSRRYYLSGNDAYRMKLLFPLPPPLPHEVPTEE